MKVNRRKFLRSATRWTIGGAVATGLYSWQVEPHWIDVVERPMAVAGLPAALEGKRLAHVTDLHVSDVVSHDYLRRAMGQVVELDPDMVMVTGDLMTAREYEQVEATAQILRLLQPDQRAVFLTPGNHDYGLGCSKGGVVSRLFDQLRAIGMHPLRNECVEHAGLQIVGCDEWYAHRFDPGRAFADYDFRRAGIALTHNPDTVDLDGWQGFSGWVLAGHTHGGQCRLPYFGAPIVPIMNRRYIQGEVDLGAGRRLYVNRGLGYSHQVRLLCSPEITVFQLTGQQV